MDAAADKWWLERGQFQDPRGLVSRLNNLVLEIGADRLLSEITKYEISEFILKCRARGRGNATINRYLALLSGICRCAREYWDCNAPTFSILSFKQIESKENIKYFKDMDTVQRLIEAAAPHIRPIILTALYTGMRRGRILNLTWNQIDFENNIITYIGKDKKNKSVPMVEPLRVVLEALPRDNDYVFTFRGHKINEFKNAWKHAFEVAGIPYLNFHALRHTTATWLLRSTGGNLRVVQRVLGHTNINTTLRYAHLLDSEADMAMNDLFKKGDKN